MRIAIDSRGANWYSGTGIGTYTRQILKYLMKHDQDNSYLLYWWGTNYHEMYQNNITIDLTSKKHHHFFEESYIPESLAANSIDVYHIPQNGMGIPSKKKCIYISTIHDLIPYVMPETVGRGYLKRFISEMPHIMQSSDYIITVSEYSKKDIIKIFDYPKEKIKVTYLAADEYFRPLDKEICKAYLENTYNITGDFLLYLGGFSPRKNVRSILVAFSRIYKELPLSYKVVIIGPSRDDHCYLSGLCDTLGISDKVVFTGYVPYEDLPYFYNASALFVYPSLYEGFGLPPLEAMSCGTPVIASNVSSIPEVVGDGAFLINPFDAEDLKNAMERMLTDNSLWNEIAQKGYQRSKEFSWDKTCLNTLKVYEEAYKRQSE